MANNLSSIRDFFSWYHADWADVSVCDREQEHDDDVGSVARKVNVCQASLIRTNVAEQEKWQEHKPSNW